MHSTPLIVCLALLVSSMLVSVGAVPTNTIDLRAQGPSSGARGGKSKGGSLGSLGNGTTSAVNREGGKSKGGSLSSLSSRAQGPPSTDTSGKSTSTEGGKSKGGSLSSLSSRAQGPPTADTSGKSTTAEGGKSKGGSLSSLSSRARGSANAQGGKSKGGSLDRRIGDYPTPVLE